MGVPLEIFFPPKSSEYLIGNIGKAGYFADIVDAADQALKLGVDKSEVELALKSRNVTLEDVSANLRERKWFVALVAALSIAGSVAFGARDALSGKSVNVILDDVVAEIKAAGSSGGNLSEK